MVTDVNAIRFCNTRARVVADMMAKLYYEATLVVNEWNAQGLSALIPNDTTVVSDGAAIDGRPQITGAMVTNIVTRCQERITDMTATSNAKLNTVLAVAVNPNP